MSVEAWNTYRDFLSTAGDSVNSQLPDDVLLSNSNEWNECFNEVHPPVRGLVIRGDQSLLSSTDINVAIVGSRRPTPYSQRIAKAITCAVASRGLTVVSGLAYGVDSIAHREALNCKASTVAVLGSGIHNVYPAANRGLADQIVAQDGAIISEYGWHAQARPWHFRERNRVIASISDTIIVIQAQRKSGSLQTALCAADLGKQVYIVPSGIDDGSYAGSLELIRDGASIVTSADSLVDEICSSVISQNITTSSAGRDRLKSMSHIDDPNQQLIFEALEFPSSIESLSISLILPVDQVAQNLLTLELSGHIHRSSDGMYSRS